MSSEGPFQKKKILFGLLAALFVVGAVEVGAFALLSVARGDLTTWSDVRALQEASGDTGPIEIVERLEARTLQQITRSSQAVHPFIGFVADPTRHDGVARGNRLSHQAIDFGFPLNREDLIRSPTDDEVVVAILGGSFAAGYAVSRDFIRPYFEKIGRFQGRKIVILSLALAGHKQPQQLMTLNYFLAIGAHFDVVINLDGFNDVALAPVANVPKGYAPFYPRGWPFLVGALDQEMRLAAGELTYLRRQRAERAELFARPPLRYSMTAALVWTTLDRQLGARISRAEQATEHERNSPSGEYQARGPQRQYASEAEMYDDQVALWKRSSILMRNACHAYGVEYFHFLQPNQYMPGSKPMNPEERRQAYMDDQPYRPVVEAAYPRLRATGEELRQAGVHFVDLTQIFADVEKTLYIDTCCHVNRDGNLLIAERMAEVMSSVETQETEVTGP